MLLPFQNFLPALLILIATVGCNQFDELGFEPGNAELDHQGISEMSLTGEGFLLSWDDVEFENEDSKVEIEIKLIPLGNELPIDVWLEGIEARSDSGFVYHVVDTLKLREASLLEDLSSYRNIKPESDGLSAKIKMSWLDFSKKYAFVFKVTLNETKEMIAEKSLFFNPNLNQSEICSSVNISEDSKEIVVNFSYPPYSDGVQILRDGKKIHESTNEADDKYIDSTFTSESNHEYSCAARYGRNIVMQAVKYPITAPKKQSDEEVQANSESNDQDSEAPKTDEAQNRTSVDSQDNNKQDNASQTQDDSSSNQGSSESESASSQENSEALNGSKFSDKSTKYNMENCIDPDLTKVPQTVMLTLCDGTVTNGSYVLPQCSIEGQEECLTHDDFIAVAKANVDATKIRVGVSIGGVDGTAQVSPFDCSWDGETECISNTSYIAVETSRILPGNIRKGERIGGVLGDYPSATYPLTSDTATTDLTEPATQLLTNDTFEFFDSKGARYVFGGDADIEAGNQLPRLEDVV